MRRRPLPRRRRPDRTANQAGTASGGSCSRSDIYSLGAVTCEMLSGDPPFTGSTAQAIVAQVITTEPRSLTAGAPAQLEVARLPSGKPDIQVAELLQGKPSFRTSAWSPDGRTPYFIALSGKLMSASIDDGPELRAGLPHPLPAPRKTLQASTWRPMGDFS